MGPLLAETIRILFNILYIFILARVIISWIRPNVQDQRWKQILRLVYSVTEPILGPIRRLLPTGNMGIDFSPFIALIALSIIRNFLTTAIYSIFI